MTATYDEERDVLYMPVGNPGPDFDGSVRPGPNRNTCGTLCLDAETGERLWFHQESPHDVWDYDSASPRMLIRDLEFDHRDEVRDTVVNAGKTGWVYSMDAETGQLITRSDPGVQQLNMFSMIPHIDDGRRGTFMPGGMGGCDWHPATYTTTRLGLCTTRCTTMPRRHGGGSRSSRKAASTGAVSSKTRPRRCPTSTTATSVPSPRSIRRRGKLVWRDWIDSDTYIWGGTMSTTTGLMFTGTQNGQFIAYDAETGERLWEFDTGDAPLVQPRQLVRPRRGQTVHRHSGRR